MQTSDAIAHFRTKVAIARALKCSKQALSKWGDIVPRHWAAELHVLTDGKLRFEQSIYVGNAQSPESDEYIDGETSLEPADSGEGERPS